MCAINERSADSPKSSTSSNPSPPPITPLHLLWSNVNNKVPGILLGCGILAGIAEILWVSLDLGVMSDRFLRCENQRYG